MKKTRAGRRVAVFTRNHAHHLQRAVGLSTAKSDAPIVFRSRTRWAAARNALTGQESVSVYIARIDGEGSVEYVAELMEVHLDPQPSQPRVAELLRMAPAANLDEGLWDETGGVQTLYVLRNCRRLAAAFPMTDLVKASDGVALSADYRYSYSVVFER
jgi:hypothetical protein